MQVVLAALGECLVAVGGPWSRHFRCAWWHTRWHASRLSGLPARVDLLLCPEQQEMLEDEAALAFTAALGNA